MSVICQDEKTAAFLAWFTSNGGTFIPAIGIAQFPGMGHGVIALEDIKVAYSRFT